MDFDVVEEYAKYALDLSIRYVLHKGEAFPRATAVVVATKGTDLLGARTYFEAPNKPVWVSPPQAEGEGVKISLGDYEGTREKQTPADATFYCFELVSTQLIQDAISEVR